MHPADKSKESGILCLVSLNQFLCFINRTCAFTLNTAKYKYKRNHVKNVKAYP